MHPDDPDPASFGPGRHLQAQLANLPAGTTAVLMLGTGLTLLGGYTGTVEIIGTDTTPAGVAAHIMIPACSCPDPAADVDPYCRRHYPNAPEELIALVARTVAASRHWERGGYSATHLSPDLRDRGVTEPDVAAALSVLTVLLQPDRHGVFGDESRPA